MEKLPNLIVEADGETFVTSPVIVSPVIGIAVRTDKKQDNILSFVIKMDTENILVEVDKKNVTPLGTIPRAGMIAMIMGKLTDDGMIFKGCRPMQILAAEEVRFREVPQGLSHMETDKFNMTSINDKNKAANMAKEHEAAIKIPIPDKPGMEFSLVGFTRIRDAAGDDVLDIKLTRDKGCILYHLTCHPDSEKTLVRLRVNMTDAGFGHIEFRNVMEQLTEIIKTYEDVESGKIKLEPGPHPNMTYLEEE